MMSINISYSTILMKKNSWKHFKFSFEIYEIFPAFFWSLHFPSFSCRMCMYLTTSHTHFPIKKCLQAVCYLCPPHHFLCSIGCATLIFALCVLPTLQQPLQMLLYASALSFPQFPPYQPPHLLFPFSHPFRPALWRFQHFFIVGIQKKRRCFCELCKIWKTFVQIAASAINV